MSARMACTSPGTAVLMALAPYNRFEWTARQDNRPKWSDLVCRFRGRVFAGLVLFKDHDFSQRGRAWLILLVRNKV